MPIKLKFGKRDPRLLRIGFIIFLIGVVGLGFPFFSFRTSDDYQTLNALAHAQAEQSRLADQFIYDHGGVPPPRPTPDPNLPNVPNRLSIPQIGVDMPIFAGESADLLLRGGWMFPGTSTPEMPSGNTVIFGHRFRYLPPISNTFYALDKINVGETFTLTWQNKKYTYKVTGKKIIEPNDFSVLNPTDLRTITLITCAPLFSTKQRLVVTAVLEL